MDRVPPEWVYRGASEQDPESGADFGAIPALRPRARATFDPTFLPGLARAVEDEIVPRLVSEHRDHAGAPGRTATVIGEREVAAFTQIALAQNIEAALAYVTALRERGATLEDVYLRLLAPAARRLGDFWVADLCDFTDVTVGVGRMQQVLRDASTEFRGELECPRHGRRILLVPAAGEQHTFGLFMVADFFARAGWDVWGGPAAFGDEAVRMARADWFDVVGLSVGCEYRLDVLAADIRALRAASRNSHAGIMVGGPVFVAHPEHAAAVGADATARDGREAPQVAEAWLKAAAGR